MWELHTLGGYVLLMFGVSSRENVLENDCWVYIFNEECGC